MKKLIWIALVLVLLCTAFLSGMQVNGYFDFFEISTPTNPPAGEARVFIDSGTGLFTCLDSAGASCNPTGSGSVSITGDFYALDGSDYYGPVFAVTPPGIMGGPSFAWRNQGGATETANGLALTLSAPVSAGNNIRGREITAPATPYTITILGDMLSINSDFHDCGLYFADNTTGRLVTWSKTSHTVASGSPSLAVGQWTNATTFSSSPFSASAYSSVGRIWLRVTDDGANHLFAWSVDGVTFQQLRSQSRTAWTAAPDRVGWFCNANNATTGVDLTLYSWVQS